MNYLHINCKIKIENEYLFEKGKKHNPFMSILTDKLWPFSEVLRSFESRKFLITRNHLEIQLENSDQNNIIRPIPPPTIILLLNNIDPLLFYLDLPRNMKETSKLHSLK